MITTEIVLLVAVEAAIRGEGTKELCTISATFSFFFFAEIFFLLKCYLFLFIYLLTTKNIIVELDAIPNTWKMQKIFFVKQTTIY